MAHPEVEIVIKRVHATTLLSLAGSAGMEIGYATDIVFLRLDDKRCFLIS
jgi:hypothetical protein